MRRLIPVLLVFLACSAPVRQLEVENQDEPDAAAEYYAARRQAPAGSDPHALYAAAREQLATMTHYSTTDDVAIDARAASAGKAIGRWTFLGPGNVGGRTRVLVIDPTAPQIMYAAAVSGGVFKTMNGGARWEPTGDALANLTVNSLVMHPQDPNTLFAGTGEGFFREEQRGTGLPLRGNGVFVTRNAGTTWTYLASTATPDFHWVNDLVISTHDPRRMYAATRTGVWRTDDEGASWTRVLETSVKGGCLDLAWRGDTANDYLFASCGTFQQATIYRSTNAEGNATWTPVHTEPNMGRTTLAIAPSEPSVIYALAASLQGGNLNQGMLAVFRSSSNGDPGSWTAMVRNDSTEKLARLLLTNVYGATQSNCVPGRTDGYTTMGWYCNVIAVDPKDANRVWIGGVDLFRSDDAGRTWGIASYWWLGDTAPTFVHADQHGIFFHPQYDGQTNKTMFATNDGGVFRTDDARAAVGVGVMSACNPSASKVAFQNLNHNYGATQFYHGAAFPDGYRFIAGAQDNGTIVGDIRQGTDFWGRVLGGDGAYVAVDQVTPNVVYAESQVGNLARSIDGGVTFKPVPLPADTFLFVNPYLIDPNEHLRVWVGGRHMSRSEDQATTWVQASPNFDGNVSALAVAPGNSNRVLAGTNTGGLWRTDDALGTTPTWTNSAPRAGFVSWLSFDPTNADVAYATYAGFGGTHVWKSIDAGATWTAIDAGLPDIPVHSIAIDPTRPARLYLGTDLGIFVSNDGGATWMVENTGYAAVVTEHVFIGRGANGPAVYAFTHGRGAWRAELVTGAKRRVSTRK